MAHLSLLVRVTVILGIITCASGWLGTAATGILHYIPPEAPSYSFESGQVMAHVGQVELPRADDVEGIQMAASPTAIFVIAIVAAYCSDLFFGENLTTSASSSSSSTLSSPTAVSAVMSLPAESMAHSTASTWSSYDDPSTSVIMPA